MYRGALAVLNDKHYVLGGSVHLERVRRSVDVYDVNTDKWSIVSEMKERREGLCKLFRALQIIHHNNTHFRSLKHTFLMEF